MMMLSFWLLNRLLLMGRGRRSPAVQLSRMLELESQPKAGPFQAGNPSRATSPHHVTLTFVERREKSVQEGAESDVVGYRLYSSSLLHLYTHHLASPWHDSPTLECPNGGLSSPPLKRNQLPSRTPIPMLALPLLLRRCLHQAHLRRRGSEEEPEAKSPYQKAPSRLLRCLHVQVDLPGQKAVVVVVVGLAKDGVEIPD